MHSLPSVIPNADELLALPVEELGAILLKIAASKMQAAGFTYEGVTEITIGSGMAGYRDSGYPPHKKPQINAHLGHAWNWLERYNLIEPSPGFNGRNGVGARTARLHQHIGAPRAAEARAPKAARVAKSSERRSPHARDDHEQDRSTSSPVSARVRYAGGPLERATFGFPCGAENPVICLHRHAPLPS
jgi:hypothetical protein